MWGPQTIPNSRPSPNTQLQTMSATKPRGQNRKYSANPEIFGNNNPSNCWSEGKPRHRINSTDQQIFGSVRGGQMQNNNNHKGISIGQYINHDLFVLFDILGKKVDD